MPVWFYTGVHNKRSPLRNPAIKRKPPSNAEKPLKPIRSKNRENPRKQKEFTNKEPWHLQQLAVFARMPFV